MNAKNTTGIILLVAAAAGAVIRWFYNEQSKKMSLGILGMEQAGKTEFLYALRGEERTEDSATSREEYEPFDLKVGDKTIKIAAGEDIGGGKEYRRQYIDKFLKEKDKIFFLFDVNQYLSSEEYARQVRSYLEAFDCGLKRVTKKQYKVIGTHADLCTLERKLIRTEIHKTVSEKEYRDLLLSNNFIVVNLTDTEEVEEMKKSLFSEQ